MKYRKIYRWYRCLDVYKSKKEKVCLTLDSIDEKVWKEKKIMVSQSLTCVYVDEYDYVHWELVTSPVFVVEGCTVI